MYLHGLETLARPVLAPRGTSESARAVPLGFLHLMVDLDDLDILI
jgi:hypothetical protein